MRCQLAHHCTGQHSNFQRLAVLYWLHFLGALLSCHASPFSCIGTMRLWSKDLSLPSDLCGRVVIVTGGTSGIGLSTVRRLAELQATVIVACRDTAKGHAVVQELKSKSKAPQPLDLRVMELQLNRLASVRDFAAAFHALDLPLHVLVNNAGLVHTSYLESADGLEEVHASSTTWLPLCEIPHFSAYFLYTLVPPSTSYTPS